MSLHDVNGRLIRPEKVEESRHIVHARTRWHPKTFAKVCKTIDEAIEHVANTGGRLAWMNTGSLVGNGSPLPHAWHHHLWSAVLELFPAVNDVVAEKGRRITVGAFVKWRTSLRDEHWFVHYRETGKEDVVTGDEIFAGEYWIKPSGIPFRRTGSR